MFEGFTLVQLLNHCEVFNVAVADDNFFLSLQNLYREYKWGGKCNLNFFLQPTTHRVWKLVDILIKKNEDV